MNRLALTILAAATVLSAGCSSEEAEPQAEIVRPVLSIVVEPRTTRTLGFAGTVEPEFKADLAFRILGRIISRVVDVGDVVTKGETIASVDSAQLELSVQSAKADLASAQAQSANAAGSEERLRLLLASGSISQADYDSAKQAQETAAAYQKKSEAALAKAEEQLGYANLFSDFDGIVTATQAEVGQTVAAGQTVVSVARSDVREAVVDVPDGQIGDIQVGSPFTVVLQSRPSVTAQGKVREIAPQSDAVTRTRRVRLTLTDPPTGFRLGSIVTVTRTLPVDPIIELPLSALLQRDGSDKVWVVDPTALTVASRDVKVGAKASGRFVVTEGLDAGMHVVTAGVNSLTDGQKVKLLGGVVK